MSLNKHVMVFTSVMVLLRIYYELILTGCDALAVCFHDSPLDVVIVPVLFKGDLACRINIFERFYAFILVSAASGKSPNALRKTTQQFLKNKFMVFGV